MQRLIGRAGLLGLALLLSACPYEAPFEPAGRTLRPDGALVGSWVCRSFDDDRPLALRVGLADRGTYSLLFRPGPGVGAPDDDRREPLTAYARPMRVAGRLLWTLRLPDEPDTPGLYLAPVQVANRRALRLAIVEDDLMPEHPASPHELTAALTRSWAAPSFASDLMSCERP